MSLITQKQIYKPKPLVFNNFTHLFFSSLPKKKKKNYAVMTYFMG